MGAVIAEGRNHLDAVELLRPSFDIAVAGRPRFARLVAEAGVVAAEIAYIGDRVDNDVVPARQVGVVAVFLRRGPWGMIHGARLEATSADLRIESLDEMPEALSWALPANDGGR